VCLDIGGQNPVADDGDLGVVESEDRGRVRAAADNGRMLQRIQHLLPVCMGDRDRISLRRERSDHVLAVDAGIELEQVAALLVGERAAHRVGLLAGCVDILRPDMMSEGGGATMQGCAGRRSGNRRGSLSRKRTARIRSADQGGGMAALLGGRVIGNGVVAATGDDDRIAGADQLYVLVAAGYLDRVVISADGRVGIAAGNTDGTAGRQRQTVGRSATGQVDGWRLSAHSLCRCRRCLAG